jgi:type IV secretory pathway VirB2 component (pilin)
VTRAGDRTRHRLRQPRLPPQYRADAFLSVDSINPWRNFMTTSRLSVKPALQAAAVVSLLLAVVGSAHAAGSNMPWEAPLQSILQSVQGPVARIVAVIIIITTGLTLAFGDSNGGFRKLVQIVFGLSIAFAASSFFLTFFSFSGGAVVA